MAATKQYKLIPGGPQKINKELAQQSELKPILMTAAVTGGVSNLTVLYVMLEREPRA